MHFRDRYSDPAFRMLTPMTDSPMGHPAGSTILVVDDEEGVRRFCRRVLESEGAQVVEAPDGAAALRLVQLGEPLLDMVITDLLMPAVTGWVASPAVSGEVATGALAVAWVPPACTRSLASGVSTVTSGSLFASSVEVWMAA